MEKVLAPLFLGAVVGFIAFYFIRKYKEFSPESLKKTLGIMALGFTLQVPVFIVFIDVYFLSWYLIGMAVGVFAYLAYLIVIKILWDKNRISDFEGYASCGSQSSEEFDDITEKINQSVKKDDNEAH